MPQYQGVWSLQQQMQALTSGQWATDPLFDYTTLLLQGDAGANGAQNNVFYDTSPNQFAITRNGNTTQGSFTPFSNQPGAWSNYFNGSSDYIYNATGNANLAFGTGDFTVECWVYLTSAPSNTYGVPISVGSSGSTWAINAVTSGSSFYFRWDTATSGAGFAVTGLYTPNQWLHVAYVRSGTTLTAYVNGIAVGTQASYTENLTVSSNLYIGTGAASTTRYLPGYVSNVRVVKGAAVYTSNFTPSSTPLGVYGSGTTALLACQSNRFLDNSGSALAFTSSGTPSVQPFSPFAPQYQWTSDVIGGSGYFDGTGDYLTVPDTTALEPGTGDFCFETWVYHTSASDGSSFDFYTDQTGGGLAVYRNLSNKIQVDSDGVVALLTSASNVPFNSWVHIAVTRSGTTLRIFINGVVDASTTNSTNIAGTSAISYGGQPAGGSILDGYLASTRFVKGSAVYTSGFSVPTAPLTAISGTQILLNYTNAGILDGTMKNNLETVGNASVSTSVVKYGSGSMYFDGSGDYLVSPTSPVNALGTANFTVEGWFYCTGYNGGAALYSGLNTYPASTGLLLYISSAGAYVVDVNGSNVISVSTAPLNTWVHYALVRNNGALALYINGTSIATAASTTNFSSQYLTIGRTAFGTASNYFLGYLDDLRITQGIARYTQNFIPPSVALPRQ